MQTVAIEGNMYTGKEILTGLPPNDYQVRVRAKNSHGWSFYSEEKIFNGGKLSIYLVIHFRHKRLKKLIN